jgi:predicted small secreted protein
VSKKLSIAVTFLVLISTAPFLGACHTTAGAGEDVSATGHALTNSADKHTPLLPHLKSKASGGFIL